MKKEKDFVVVFSGSSPLSPSLPKAYYTQGGLMLPRGFEEYQRRLRSKPRRVRKKNRESDQRS